MKKLNLFGEQNGRVLAVAVILVLVGVFVVQWKNMQTAGYETQGAMVSSTKGEIREVKIKDHVYQVEVMTTAPQIQRGLSGRTEIGADGMLFVFSQRAKYTFWMKEMLFDLDFLWIDDGKVAETMQNVPKPALPDTPDQNLLHYQPQVPVNMVLELPAGFISANNIQVGDEVRILE